MAVFCFVEMRNKEKILKNIVSFLAEREDFCDVLIMHILGTYLYMYTYVHKNVEKAGWVGTIR